MPLHQSVKLAGISVAAIVILPLLRLLMRMACHSSDTGTCGASNQGTFKATAEDCTQSSSTGSSDQGTSPGANTVALVVIAAVAIIVTVIVSVVVA